MSTTFACDTCYDTKTIDAMVDGVWGEVRCPDCVDPYAVGSKVRIIKGRLAGRIGVVRQRTAKTIEVRCFEGDKVVAWDVVRLSSCRPYNGAVAK